jgi:hypothetical protein
MATTVADIITVTGIIIITTVHWANHSARCFQVVVQIVTIVTIQITTLHLHGATTLPQAAVPPLPQETEAEAVVVVEAAEVVCRDRRDSVIGRDAMHCVFT